MINISNLVLTAAVVAISLFQLSAAMCKGGIAHDGQIVGDAIVKSGKAFATGNYSFKSVSTGKYLQMQNPGNLVTPVTIAKVDDSTTWQVMNHETVYHSIHHLNNVKHPKCFGARWVKPPGCDDAVVLWQCEVDMGKRKRSLGKRYQPIRSDKELWLFVPVKNTTTKGAYLIVATAHLFDMTPACVVPVKVSGGTQLDSCLKPNAYWYINKQK
ncbi:hypothetical protein BC938DRAFT_470793 [Jimgerdemannia flammicorona]|uniref:Ricin B lectin domain-containing protein n=1 Tax=Jimgerdemannia flammicorona TaxID=994334 RepID=A0A433Q9E6_9FUNG|nr:hypothetical protein BC938DRAFT_470793 [Jimgerdemannia flammicorona]